MTAQQDMVMVIPAGKWAWDMYKPLSVYRCKVDKPMRIPIKHFSRLAFYADGKIQKPIPKIKSVIDSIDITKEEEIEFLDSDQKKLAKKLLGKVDHYNRRNEFDDKFKIMFLSAYDEEETENLPRIVENDKRDKNGKPTAFTQSHRYVTLESLKNAHKTSDLVIC